MVLGIIKLVGSLPDQFTHLFGEYQVHFACVDIETVQTMHDYL